MYKNLVASTMCRRRCPPFPHNPFSERPPPPHPLLNLVKSERRMPEHPRRKWALSQRNKAWFNRAKVSHIAHFDLSLSLVQNSTCSDYIYSIRHRVIRFIVDLMQSSHTFLLSTYAKHRYPDSLKLHNISLRISWIT